MCIGIPMQLRSVAGDRGLVEGPQGPAVVDLRLVGPCAPGQWLLIFQGAARELLDDVRAGEIRQTLQLLADGLNGLEAGHTDPGFDLPSAMDAAALARLTGQPAR